MQPLKKISTATVFGKITSAMLAALEEKPDMEIPIMRITGLAVDTKKGQGDNGPWIALTGEFVAANAKTGELYVAPTCFIPGPMQAIVAARMNQANVTAVEFAVDIGIKFSDSPIRYEYVNRTLIKDDENASPAMRLLKAVQGVHPMAAIANKMGLQGPAPEPAPAESTPTKPATKKAARPTPAK